jgi:transposase
MQWTVAIGVDTHKDVHVAVALDAYGRQLDSLEIPTSSPGYRRLLSWAEALGVPAFAIEGVGSYGAGLVRFLRQADVAVYECERPCRQERRRGKNDLLDAAVAARRRSSRLTRKRPPGLRTAARSSSRAGRLSTRTACRARRARPPRSVSR